MSKFNFRLEKVLDYRKMQEDEAACALAVAIRHYENTKQQLVESAEELEENVVLRLENDSCSSVAENIHVFLYRDSMLCKIEQLKDGLEQAHREAELKRQDLIGASKECKVLGKLREKHYKSYLYNENLKDQKVQDELAKQAFLTHKF